MTKQLTLYADANGNITADDQPNASTVAMRDNSGGLAAVAGTFEDLTASETLVIGEHATVTSVAALDNSAVVWPFDGSGGAFAPTLPPVASCVGRVFICKRVAAGNITLTPNGSEKIDGASTYVLSALWATVWLFSDGTQWLILAKF